MSSPIRRLPDSELAVMQAVWECDTPAIRTDIERVLFQTQKIASTTLLTVLSRLRDKGFLSIEKDGRAHRYRPLISRQEYLAAQSRSFFKNLCGGSIPTFATALCDSGISQEELAELRDLLERDAL